jgi:hypothetical protein
MSGPASRPAIIELLDGQAPSGDRQDDNVDADLPDNG